MLVEAGLWEEWAVTRKGPDTVAQAKWNGCDMVSIVQWLWILLWVEAIEQLAYPGLELWPLPCAVQAILNSGSGRMKCCSLPVQARWTLCGGPCHGQGYQHREGLGQSAKLPRPHATIDCHTANREGSRKTGMRCWSCFLGGPIRERATTRKQTNRV